MNCLTCLVQVASIGVMGNDSTVYEMQRIF